MLKVNGVKMTPDEYLTKKLEETIPGFKNGYIPCVTEIEITKDKVIVKCVDLDGIVMYNQELNNNIGTIIINNLHFKLKD